MKEFLNSLAKTALFQGISESEIESMLNCLQARKAEFKKGEYIFLHGESISSFGILLKGLIHIQKSDYWGNLSIVNAVGPLEMFAEAYAIPGSSVILNDVVAMENSTVIFFDIRKMLTTCTSACVFHTKTVENLFRAVSTKNINLIRKLDHITKKTTREKLISYLSEESEKHRSPSFSIPFNRQQLADFLSVDRSAMSLELSKMQKEGLLTYNKNNFTLL